MLRAGRPVTPREWEAYFELRWRILRAPWGQPRGSERDASDAIADHVTIHDAHDRLLGVGRLHLHDAEEARIRYMASEPDCRGQGVGRALIEKLEQLAGEYAAKRIVLNAREDALGFYERLGYVIVGQGHILYGEIRHTCMQKLLCEKPHQGQ